MVESIDPLHVLGVVDEVSMDNGRIGVEATGSNVLGLCDGLNLSITVRLKMV
jgi:hypothetical protein